MAENYKSLRRFERLLFSGVPEAPEPSYQRELNAIVPERYTGKSQLVDSNEVEESVDSILIAEITYFVDQETIEIKRLID